MTAAPLVAATTWTRAGGARFTAEITPPWFQGKGAYGGLLNAGVLRAMMTVVDAPARRPRTLHVHFCAPAREGPLTCDVVVERAGATMSTLSARVRQGDTVVTLASATFAVPRPRPEDALVYLDAQMPAVPAPEGVPTVPPDVPVLPAFTQFFEYRMCLGDPPLSSSPRSLVGGWLRPREPVVVDAPAVAALIDAYPPALMPRLPSLRAASSVDMTIDFHGDPAAVAPGAHVLIVQSSRVGDGGMTDERCDLWSADGVLVATARQLVALL